MDILLAPKDPIAPVDEIPFVCGDLAYDYDNFLTYPGRTGRDGSLQQPSTVLNRRPRFVRPNSWEPSETLEPHFQTWLFFGLLSEWLGGNKWIDTMSSATGALTVNPSSAKTPTINSLYDKLVYEADGKKWLTTRDLMSIIDEGYNSLLAQKEDQDHYLRRLWNIGLCIQHTEHLLASCPRDFDWRIRHSIGALGEALSFVINGLFPTVGLKCVLGGYFSRDYFNSEIETRMMRDGGWCPSDVTRVTSIYRSLHTLNLLTKMKRSGSQRDHSKCTKMRCQAYQVDLTVYKVTHTDRDCNCKLFSIDNSATIQALENVDSFPLLRITGGESDLNDIGVEVIEAKENTPYIAISHVWADGLGNPYANSLHACQLSTLRNLATDLDESAESSSGSSGKSNVLLWLDTLCCPVEPLEAKRLALKRLQRVYENATHTLVLDETLRSTSTKGMSMYEIMCRIFTSSWMRRLWTLQESALSKSLWFQFSDRAVSLEQSMDWVRKDYNAHLEYRRIALDIIEEDRMMRVFFKGSVLDNNGPRLEHLDFSLRNRSVSIPSDEALCIGTLMSLDISAIVEAPEQDKMKRVWTLLAQKNNGLPARMIIIHGSCFTDPGWRWAPKTLLEGTGNVMNFAIRSLHWQHPDQGFPSPYGLKVKFPGVLLKPREYDDGLPRHPWKEGLNRPPESIIMFRDPKGAWYSLADLHQSDPETSINWRYTENEMEEWRKRGPYPLHDIIDSGNAAVILVEELSHLNIWTSLLVTVRNDTEGLENLEGLAVKTEAVALFSLCSEYNCLIWDTIDRTSKIVRQSEATRKLLEVRDKKSDEYQQAKKPVLEEMKRVMGEAIAADANLVQALERWAGPRMEDHMWKYIGEFYNADFVSTALPDDQCWFVD